MQSVALRRVQPVYAVLQMLLVSLEVALWLQISSEFQCQTTCVSIVDEQSVLLKTTAPKAHVIVEKHNYIFPRSSGLVGWLCLPECRQVLLVDDPAADIRSAPVGVKSPSMAWSVVCHAQHII